MRVSSRMIRLVLEASEAAGVSPDVLAAPLGMRSPQLRGLEAGVEWARFVAMLDGLGAALGEDADRIRDVGRHMVPAPENAFLQRVARTAVSPRQLYEIGTRWAAPANFAHVPLDGEFDPGGRLRLRSEIPAAYAPSSTFFRLFEGMVLDLPRLCGRPPAEIVRSRISPRSLDLLVEIPRSTSALGRLRRRVGAALRAGETAALFELQRAALEEGAEALRRSQEKSRSLVEGLPDLVFVHVGGSILWANRTALRTLGFGSPDALQGTLLLDLIAPSSRALALARMASRMAPATSVELTETWFLTRDGSSVAVEVAPPQAIVFAGVRAQLVVGRDVTEQVRARERLVAADRLASVGLLAAGVARELSGPLSEVLGGVERAAAGLEPLGPAAARSRDSLAVALEGVARIRAITLDLMALAPPERGELGPVDVEAVLETTLSLVREELDRTARLVRRYDEAPPVRASAGRLAQLLLNLIVNALQAMAGRPADRNELSLRVGPGQKGLVLVEVSDNGEGIAPEHMGRIFEPFFTTKPEGVGTGLGLSITQRLVLELGGEIEVFSVPGKGSTFRVSLSAAGPAPESAPGRVRP